jgi:hypothetical protein
MPVSWSRKMLTANPPTPRLVNGFRRGRDRRVVAIRVDLTPAFTSGPRAIAPAAVWCNAMLCRASF